MPHSSYSFELDVFPFKSILSLHHLINFWKEKVTSGTRAEVESAKQILLELEQIPQLSQEIDDWKIIDKHYSLVNDLFSRIISPFQQEEGLFCASPPYGFEFFYSTKKMDEIFGKKAGTMMHDFWGDTKPNYYGPVLHVYARLLEELYGAHTNFEIPLYSVRKFDEDLNIYRYYSLFVDNRFVDIIPKGRLKKLSKEKIELLNNNFFNLEMWMKTLPPEDFVLKGFALSYLIDSTPQLSVSTLKNKLLDRNALISKEQFTSLEKRMRSLLKLSELDLGIAIFRTTRGRFRDYLSTWHSILPDPSIICQRFEDSVYDRAITKNLPILISDLEAYPEKGDIELSLLKAGYKSIAVAPLFFEEQLVGVIELGSPNKNDITYPTFIKMNEVVPLFAIAAARRILDLENQIKAKIQEEFTAIHPIVEWKFTDAASNMLRLERGEDDIEKDPILFEDVYPLYGACDIRSSSQERNSAIQKDLTEQLTIAKKILLKAFQHKTLPIFNQLVFEIDQHLDKLKGELYSGDEVSIIDFLRKEIEPLFLHLKDADIELKDDIDSYDQKLDKENRVLYKKRNEFEESIGMINDTITAVIDEQEEEAQKMYPHYFEKYRTDGIEYNIYIGQSLLQKGKFESIYLKNLRLWQLMVMCKIARKTSELKKDLPIPLDTTQLILVHNKPLSIRFREDEKKFDVEGGYNIRYEITKKRIDKAHIKGTRERLTKPGTIAIIYSQPDEMTELRRYIKYLISINYLDDKIDNYELEEMQGVFGLKAFRVTINLSSKIKKKHLKVSDMIEEAKDLKVIN